MKPLSASICYKELIGTKWSLNTQSVTDQMWTKCKKKCFNLKGHIQRWSGQQASMEWADIFIVHVIIHMKNDRNSCGQMNKIARQTADQLLVFVCNWPSTVSPTWGKRNIKIWCLNWRHDMVNGTIGRQLDGSKNNSVPVTSGPFPCLVTRKH